MGLLHISHVRTSQRFVSYSQARCLQEIYVNSNRQFHSRSNYDSSPQKALQTIISLRTVCYTIHTDLVKAYLTSCIVCSDGKFPEIFTGGNFPYNVRASFLIAYFLTVLSTLPSFYDVSLHYLWHLKDLLEAPGRPN
jgi:hypothetical protein